MPKMRTLLAAAALLAAGLLTGHYLKQHLGTWGGPPSAPSQSALLLKKKGDGYTVTLTRIPADPGAIAAWASAQPGFAQLAAAKQQQALATLTRWGADPAFSQLPAESQQLAVGHYLSEISRR